MKSMTGYSFVESPEGEGSFRVDIKGYNNRYREIAVSLPGDLSPLEPEIKDILAGVVQRGKVEVTLRSGENEGRPRVWVDHQAAAEYQTALQGLSRELGLPGAPTLELITAQEGVLRRETRIDLDEVRSRVLPLVRRAAEGFDQSRLQEGERTARDVEGHLVRLEENLALFRETAPGVEAMIKENLQERFREVLDGDPEDPRLLAETAVLLVRYSINEELVRLDSHLESFRSMAEQPQAVGKKLDFLCQEIGREINTIGSKTPLAEVQHGVVRAKDALENIREQLRNVE